MTGRKRRGPHGQLGQAIVEFALVSSILMGAFFGIIQFGLVVWEYNMVSDLAQEGARWAAVRGSTATLQATNNTVRSFVQGRAVGLGPTVTTSWPDGGSPANAPGKRVEVNVQKTFYLHIPMIRNDTLTLQSTSRMVIAR